MRYVSGIEVDSESGQVTHERTAVAILEKGGNVPAMSLDGVTAYINAVGKVEDQYFDDTGTLVDNRTFVNESEVATSEAGVVGGVFGITGPLQNSNYLLASGIESSELTGKFLFHTRTNGKDVISEGDATLQDVELWETKGGREAVSFTVRFIAGISCELM